MKLHYTVQITNFRNRPWLRAPQGCGFKLASAGFLFYKNYTTLEPCEKLT